VLNNKLLIIAGALDGASGVVLSIIMCKAMNRSFTNVLFGAFGQVQAGAGKQAEKKAVKSASPEEAAGILEAAQSVIIIPGYGMAVAQAQHKVRELFDQLTKRGVNVRFAIHPVAGRMPGHRNGEVSGPFSVVRGWANGLIIRGGVLTSNGAVGDLGPSLTLRVLFGGGRKRKSWLMLVMALGGVMVAGAEAEAHQAVDFVGGGLLVGRRVGGFHLQAHVGVFRQVDRAEGLKGSVAENGVDGGHRFTSGRHGRARFRESPMRLSYTRDVADARWEVEWDTQDAERLAGTVAGRMPGRGWWR
jgi:hypothetical protein